MTDPLLLSFDQRPVVIVFTDPSALATALVEFLVAGLARVRIVSDKVAQWRKQIDHLSQNRSVDVVSRLQRNDLGDSSYLVFVHSDEHIIPSQKVLNEKQKQLKQVKILAKELQPKALGVLQHQHG